jgi:hypothetical protein
LLGYAFAFGENLARITVIWTAIGVVLYFAYGYRMSKLHRSDGGKDGGSSGLAPESV